ncbi:hypothetical protein BURPS1710A_A0782 [Burkholderia pseudomallei 1710a]|uniref:Uncharacterized protein n=1 Tax=Burkholderia pseudomallei 1710a TaxID=320371 RepID=A0A0E1VRZ4_BURPE|nr:hypothetical protein BURPS1710A_A0782 [Burkholderia pseudomallei 1710a]
MKSPYFKEFSSRRVILQHDPAPRIPDGRSVSRKAMISS